MRYLSVFALALVACLLLLGGRTLAQGKPSTGKPAVAGFAEPNCPCPANKAAQAVPKAVTAPKVVVSQATVTQYQRMPANGPPSVAYSPPRWRLFDPGRQRVVAKVALAGPVRRILSRILNR